ncbi:MULTISPECIES: energy transducer TonB [Dethiosulfovibrio]|uniref:TonB family protein n=2 Tax=Dethiosulfovibrio TaxID=47054 RepID=A0ABS9EJ59_9BACT|nr:MULTISPECIES: energy transducer TonB [Dethiosulfovibrio]MCF4112780.1 TonB family protein [Dethiosulfovibrio russensis]MCF4141244.1 TonB family protein [Dethiosulfovibrio marinus]MCF4144930.1 TonB family protein [Dethiosulfovibrio acidaminovorans]
MKRWIVTIAASLILHAGLLCLLPWAPKKSDSVGTISVKLVRTRAKNESAVGQDSGSAMAETPPERPKAEKAAPLKPTTSKEAEKPSTKEDSKIKTPEKPQKTVEKTKPVVQKTPVAKPRRKKTEKPKVEEKKDGPEKKVSPPSKKEGAKTEKNEVRAPLGKGLKEGTSTKEGPHKGGGEAKKPTASSRGEILSEHDVTVEHREIPEYPLISRKRKEQGTVTVLLSVKKGRVIETRIEKSSGSPRLDKAALKALRGWRFSSDLSAEVRIPVLFKLTK